MFTVADPRPTPTAPMDLPQTKTGPGASRARRASRLSRTAPDVMHGHHSSLLAALREEDTDDEFDDDDAFAFAPKGEGTPSTPRGTHRVFAAGKESMDSPTSPLVTHTKPHTKTYGFAPAPPPSPAPPPDPHAAVAEDANVTVKMRGTKDLEVTLTADETAASLRAKLERMRPGYARHLGGPYPRDNRACDSQLFFGGRELRDGPLNVYGVADGATLELRPHTFGVSGVPIPATSRGSRERHSWNDAAAWNQKPAAAAEGSWVSSATGTGESIHGRVARFGGAYDDSESSRWSGFSHGSASSSSSEHYGSPEVARSFDLARRGLAMGNRPQLARGGTGGAYFLRDGDGETCAVFKPADEEPNARNNPRGRNVSVAGEGLRKGTRVGEGASREVAAYLLDHDGFASVPATSLANLCDGKKAGGGEGEGKLGSLQAFVRADAEAEELGPGTFPTREVHKITQLDIRLANTDRNAGNILVQKRGVLREGGTGVVLVPIDHGYALPHTLEDVFFEWEFWPQAKIPYDDETKAYIAGLDVERDAALLRAEGIELSPASERVLRVCTVLLQKAAQRGCCPADIAGMMSRPMPNRASDLEKLASRAAAAALAGGGPGASAAAPSPVVDAWRALDGNADAESRFLSEYAHLLDSYLEGFEPELAL